MSSTRLLFLVYMFLVCISCIHAGDDWVKGTNRRSLRQRNLPAESPVDIINRNRYAPLEELQGEMHAVHDMYYLVILSKIHGKSCGNAWCMGDCGSYNRAYDHVQERAPRCLEGAAVGAPSSVAVGTQSVIGFRTSKGSLFCGPNSVITHPSTCMYIIRL